MKLRVTLVLTAILLIGQSAFAQKHEIAFTSGGLKVGERGFDLPQPGFLRFSTGFTYEISYAERLFDARLAALYFEIPLGGHAADRGQDHERAFSGQLFVHLLYAWNKAQAAAAREVFAVRNAGRRAVALQRKRHDHCQSTQPEPKLRKQCCFRFWFWFGCQSVFHSEHQGRGA